MDDHISRILKMLEEGKISAADAETLIAALRTEPRNAGASAAAAGGGAASSSTASRPSETRSETKTQSAASSTESETSKSFEFRWSQRRSFPFDLSNIGKQITDLVRKLDPDRIIREVRSGASGAGRRWQERVKTWSWFMEDEEGPPENTMGYPTERAEEHFNFTLPANALFQVENNYGEIVVRGGDQIRIDAEKVAWAQTSEEAQSRLREVQVETAAFTPETGASRLETRVTAPEGWREGYVNLRIEVPAGMSLRLGTTYGAIRVENVAGQVECHAISGEVVLENVQGEARAESISGDIRASEIGGALHLTSKSGSLSAERLSRGGSVVGVSGDVRVQFVEGGRLEARSISGDVLVEQVGQSAPLDIAAESVSGDVKVTHARGNMTLKTVSGDIHAEHLEVTTLQGQAVSGDIHLRLDADFVGTLSTNTVSGDVAVHIPETSNFRFTLVTQSGDLRCDHALSNASRTDTLWTGTVGTGAGNVSIQTLSGDVRLGKPE
jgi:DUF4097 and DUF4098 domain-containing protein YvlB